MNKIHSKIALAASFSLALAFVFGCATANQKTKAEQAGSSSSSSSSIGKKAAIKDSAVTTAKDFSVTLKDFTDSRDGKKYKSVKIGEQTWMAENLNYKAEGSKCYGNKPENCAKYGRLYNWNTAMKTCPDAWHLPSDEEWTKLIAFIGNEIASQNLKSNDGWDKGGYGSSDGRFTGVGSSGQWWGFSEFDSESHAFGCNMGYGVQDVTLGYSLKSHLYSVRCVKD